MREWSRACNRAMRSLATLRLMTVNTMASMPQAMPIKAAGATAATWLVSGVNTCTTASLIVLQNDGQPGRINIRLGVQGYSKP